MAERPAKAYRDATKNEPVVRQDHGGVEAPPSTRRSSVHRVAQLPEVIRGDPAPSGQEATAPPAIPGAQLPLEALAPLLEEQYRYPGIQVQKRYPAPEPTPEVQQRYDSLVDVQEPDNTLDLIVGRPKLLAFKQAPRRVYIPDEEIAQYNVIDDRQLVVVGKQAGVTALDLWFPDPAAPDDPRSDQTLRYLIVVRPDEVPLPQLPSEELRRRLESEFKQLEEQLNRAFPESVVELSVVGTYVVVSGQAKDIIEAAQILRIVNEHALLGRDSRVDPRRVKVSFVGDGLGDTEGAANAIRELLRTNPNLVNRLRIPGIQQVMLRVMVAEVQRSAARQIGMDFSLTNDDGLQVFSQATAGLLSTATGATMPNLPTFLDNGQVELAIKALRNLSLARTLAEPNLTTLHGRPASFHAGGSFPVPSGAVSFGAAAQGVEYIPFGVELQFTPYITDTDRIRLELRAEVSTRSIDTAEVANAEVPREVNERTFSTTVELREGQTLAVAGLIRNDFGANADRVPLWGDLPLIGRTGGFDRTTGGEQELVILVTPQLVYPLESREAPPVPGADVFEPSDVEFYLMGRLEGRRKEDFRSSVRTDFSRQKRRCCCMGDVFIIGKPGHTFCRTTGCIGPGGHLSAQPPPSEPSPQQPEMVPTPEPQGSRFLEEILEPDSVRNGSD